MGRSLDVVSKFVSDLAMRAPTVQYDLRDKSAIISW